MSNSGLNLRKGPSIHEKKIITIPKNEEVLFCNDSAYPETIDGIEGTWVRSEYNGLVGYLFSGYVETKKCIDSDIRLVIPNDGSGNFPLVIYCDPYQGIYKANQEGNFKNQYPVKTIQLVDTTVDHSLKYFGNISNQDEQPLFLISGLSLKNKIEGKFLKKMFFPFESKLIWNENIKRGSSVQYIVYAKGVGILNDKVNEMSIYEKIENYELWIRRFEKGKKNIDLLIFKTDLTKWLGDYQGGAWIYWIGHLNEDKIPDIIIKTSKTYKGWNYKLLLSDPSQKDKIYKILKVGAGSLL